MTTDYLTVAFSRKSQKWQNSFPENKFPRFGHIRTNNADLRGPENGKTHFRKTSFLVLTTSAQIMPTFWRTIRHFFAWTFLNILNVNIFESILHVDNCVLKKFRKLPSARRIFPKVFRRSHFWTSILVHFLKIFSSLVQTHFEI